MKKIFLGGTCNESQWRNKLIPFLKIDYFNPVVEIWNEDAKQAEIKQRAVCDWCLYYVTPYATGLYAIAELIDDTHKRPNKTIFGYTEKEGIKCFTAAQLESLEAIGKMVKKNGAYWFDSLEEIAEFVNKAR